MNNKVVGDQPNARFPTDHEALGFDSQRYVGCGQIAVDERAKPTTLTDSEIVVWLLTSNLIAPNKVGAAAPIFLSGAPTFCLIGRLRRSEMSRSGSGVDNDR